MKRIFFLLIIISYLFPICFADIEVKPYYINSIRRTGIGLTSITSPLIMRQEPNDEGKILETLNFDFKTNKPNCLINKQRCSIDEVFTLYKQDKKTAFLSTIDETENWSLVCFNQTENPICGWIKEDKNKYYTWPEFYNYYGKKYGLYFLKDVQKTDRILYSAPVKQTNSTGSIEMAKHIAPWLVQGNWVLVKALDFGNKPKTGWLNYRANDGKLKLFVDF